MPVLDTIDLSVSELSFTLRKTLECAFRSVRVRGELGRVSRPSSGHIYLDLKDEKSIISGIIWKGKAIELTCQPEEGLEVVVSGRLTTYPGQSRYQIIVNTLELAGAGALMALLEERRNKLRAEGLFNDDRKKSLPSMPKVIAVLTSPTGAVIRDILHRISDRFPCFVLVWPVCVQGKSCSAEVTNGIERLNALPSDGELPKPDLIIVARGGGSLEDLWGFNDESIVRAVSDSNVPLISAVGHETDWTLIDYVADWRAPTPTAAAEKAVPVRIELEVYLVNLSERLNDTILRFLERCHLDRCSAARGLMSYNTLIMFPQRKFDEVLARAYQASFYSKERKKFYLNKYNTLLSKRTLTHLIEENTFRLNELSANRKHSLSHLILLKKTDYKAIAYQISAYSTLERKKRTLQSFECQPNISIKTLISDQKDKLIVVYRLFNNLNYSNVLSRGYAVIYGSDNRPISRVKSVVSGQVLTIEMFDGKLNVVAEKEISEISRIS